MNESTGKHRKRYVDHMKDISRITCLIHVTGHSPDEFKVLGDFGTTYAKDKPTKYCRHIPATRKKFGRQQ